jgi:hypothetical protein
MTSLREVMDAIDRAEDAVVAARTLLAELLYQQESSSSSGDAYPVDTPAPLKLDPIWLELSEISKAAQTRRAEPLTRDMDPRKLGYLVEQFNSAFPNVRYEKVLQQFLSWYIAKGDTSRNWFEKFLSYAQGAQDRATVGGIETDSIGLPKDAKTRRRFLGND